MLRRIIICWPLFALLAASSASTRRLSQEAEDLSFPDSAPLVAQGDGSRLGVFFDDVGDSSYITNLGDGDIWTGFDVDMVRALTLDSPELANLDIKITRLPKLEDRISYLVNGTVDWVLGNFAITPEREAEVDFVRPAYMSGAAALFALDTKIPGVANWTDLAGMRIALKRGFYLEKELLDYGIIPIYVDNSVEGTAAVQNGSAVALVDGTHYEHSGLNQLAVPEPIGKVAYGIAVQKGNTDLKNKLSRALMLLIVGGNDASILKIERGNYGSKGFPPNEDLRALVNTPVDDTFLNPRSCVAGY